MSIYRGQLGLGATFTILQNWTQAAELEIEADRIQDAILVLSDSSDAFGASAFTREYSRAVKLFSHSIGLRIGKNTNNSTWCLGATFEHFLI